MALVGACSGAFGFPDRWFETVEYRDDLALLGQAFATGQISG